MLLSQGYLGRRGWVVWTLDFLCRGLTPVVPAYAVRAGQLTAVGDLCWMMPGIVPGQRQRLADEGRSQRKPSMDWQSAIRSMLANPGRPQSLAV